MQAHSASPLSAIASIGRDTRHRPSEGIIRDPTESAILSSGHLSSTESLFKWPVFLDHPSITEESSSPFASLEYSRPPYQIKIYGIFPSVSMKKVKEIVGIFQQTYNTWFPTMGLENLRSLQVRISNENLEPCCQSCLGCLVMALGCIGASLIDGTNTPDDERQQLKMQGATWFNIATKMLHFAHIEISVEGCQCLLLTR